MRLNDSEFLSWVADRLVHVYRENPNVDFVLHLRRLSKELGTPKKKVANLTEQGRRDFGIALTAAFFGAGLMALVLSVLGWSPPS